MNRLLILFLSTVLLLGSAPAFAQNISINSSDPNTSALDRATFAVTHALSQGLAVSISASQLAELIDDFESSELAMAASAESASSLFYASGTRHYSCPPFRYHGWWGTQELNIWANANVSNSRVTEVTDHGYSYGLYNHIIPSLDWVVTGSSHAYAQNGGRRIRLGFIGQGNFTSPA